MARKIVIDQFTMDGVFIQSWPCAAFAATALGCDRHHINDALDKKNLSAAGFKWKTSIDQTAFVKPDIVHDYNKEQRDDFERKVKKHERILTNLLYKPEYITSANREDYKQEALISAWQSFHRFVPNGINDGYHFGAWFKMTCAWAIHGYFLKQKQFNRHHAFFDFDITVFDIEEDLSNEYKESRFQLLYTCVGSLPEKEQKVMKRWLQNEWNETNNREMAFELQLTPKNFNKIKQRGIGLLRDKMKLIESERSTENQHSYRRPVDQFDLEGNFIAGFPSITEAVKSGFDRLGISAVLNHTQKSHKGFKWKYSAQ